MKLDLEQFLNENYLKYNQKWFIETDPIQVPHLLKKRNILKKHLKFIPKNPGPLDRIIKNAILRRK